MQLYYNILFNLFASFIFLFHLFILQLFLFISMAMMSLRINIRIGIKCLNIKYSKNLFSILNTKSKDRTDFRHF